MPGKSKRSTLLTPVCANQSRITSSASAARNHGRYSGLRAMMPIFAELPLSPLRPTASAMSGTAASATPIALGGAAIAGAADGG